MKFQPGDRIRVKENGLTGTILAVAKINQDDSYIVMWDHYFHPLSYMANQIDDDLWEQIGKIKDAHILSIPGSGYVNQDPDVLPPGRGLHHIDIKITVGDEKKECNHKWVEVGFMHTKTVCYHCDVEKK